MVRRKLHIVFSLLLLLSTTEYLWAQQLFDKEDSVEIQETESTEDSELKEREAESEEESKFHGFDPGYHTTANLKDPHFGKLQQEEQLSAVFRTANQKLFILFHQLKISS